MTLDHDGYLSSRTALVRAAMDKMHAAVAGAAQLAELSESLHAPDPVSVVT